MDIINTETDIEKEKVRQLGRAAFYQEALASMMYCRINNINAIEEVNRIAKKEYEEEQKKLHADFN